MTEAKEMIVRLANVLYWLGSVIAIVMIFWAALIVLEMTYASASQRFRMIDDLLFVLLGAISAYLVGAAIRYVLVGRGVNVSWIKRLF
jgi:undecaprenyl pyrophosphate phosphatase UppP